MNFKFGKRKAQFGKPNFNYKNDKKTTDRLRWLKQPVKHKVTLKELDMLIPVEEGRVKTSEFLYDKKGTRSVHVLPEIPIDRFPESLSFSIFDNPNAGSIDLEGATGEALVLFLGDSAQEISIAYKLKFDLPSDQARRSRLLNCMGEEVQFSVKNTKQELFDDPDEDDSQADLDKDGKAKAAGAEPPASVQ